MSVTFRGGGDSGQHHLEQSDRVPAVGHRDDHPGPAVECGDVDLLGPQDLLVHRPAQGQGLGLLDAVAAGARDTAGRREPDDGPAGEVGDEQRHFPRPHHVAEGGGDRFDGIDRCGRLDLLQQCADVDHGVLRLAHGQTPGASASRRDRRAQGTGRRCRAARHPGGPAAPGKRGRT